jgi:hypothetical protein
MVDRVLNQVRVRGEDFLDRAFAPVRKRAAQGVRRSAINIPWTSETGSHEFPSPFFPELFLIEICRFEETRHDRSILALQII